MPLSLTVLVNGLRFMTLGGSSLVTQSGHPQLDSPSLTHSLGSGVYGVRLLLSNSIWSVAHELSWLVWWAGYVTLKTKNKNKSHSVTYSGHPALTVRHGLSPYSVLLAGAATSIIFVTTKVLSQQTHVCRDKTCLLTWQKYACHDKTFVTTKLFCCCDKHNFVMTSILLSQQTRVVTKVCFLWHNFCHDTLVTKVLSRQAYFCRDKRQVLSWQNLSPKFKSLGV